MNGFAAMFRKELTQMLRDRGTLFFAIAVPVFELILFGVIDMNAKNIPTAIFDQSRTQESRRLIEQFGNTSYLQRDARYVASRAELQHADRGRPRAGGGRDSARLRAQPRRRSGTADVLVMIDGSDSSVATQALSAANGVVLSNSINALMEKTAQPLVEAHPVMMFNPDMRSANLLIPGLISILLTFSGTILSAFAIVKERERGTLEQLMVTPVSPLAVVTGKLLPYLGLAYLQLLLILFLMRFLFRVPIHGSLTLLLAALAGLPPRAAVGRPARLLARELADGGDAARDGDHAALGAAVRLHLPDRVAAAAAARRFVRAAGDALHQDRARHRDPRRDILRSLGAGRGAAGDLRGAHRRKRASISEDGDLNSLDRSSLEQIALLAPARTHRPRLRLERLRPRARSRRKLERPRPAEADRAPRRHRRTAGRTRHRRRPADAPLVQSD